MLTDQNDLAALKQLFLDNIDQDRLGKRAVGGLVWKQAKSKWREKALDMYFSMLFSGGSQATVGMKNAAATKIEMHLAEQPQVKTPDWHIVVKLKIDNGKSKTVAILMTQDCKAFDFAQGDWASQFIGEAEVTAAMR